MTRLRAAGWVRARRGAALLSAVTVLTLLTASAPGVASSGSPPASGTASATARATAGIGGLSVEARTSVPSLTASPRQLSVSVLGNQLVDGDGQVVRLLGVNRSGTQYACAQGWGIFDGPVDDRALDAIVSWNVTAVRLSLNEHCWLGINGVPAAYSGQVYRDAVTELVDRLVARRVFVILTLHWNAAGEALALNQQPMADRDHAPEFWRSVASTFADRPAVLFDLYNEPHPDDNRDTSTAWACVRDGGSCPGVGFVAAGSQELVDAVRSVGARNVLLVGGTQHAGSLTRWLEHAPRDPLGQVAASIHIYGPDFSACADRACWDATIAPVAAQVPVVMGEIGIASPLCTPVFVLPLMEWADAHGVSYLAWSWIVGSCTAEPSLIADYSGVPTGYGLGVRTHLLRVAQRP